MLSDPMTQLNNGINLQKYKKAGTIAAKVLNTLVNLCKPGQIIYKLCSLGDDLINNEVKKVYKNISSKGIAFPTCISTNNIVGFYSPSSTEYSKDNIIKDGDLVKIELGVHIDGFPALVAYTVVVNENNLPIIEKKANVVKAAIESSKEILKMMRPGKTNMDVTKILEKYAKKYKCSLPIILENVNAPGIISYQMSRYIIDGHNDDDSEYVHHMILSKYHNGYEFSMIETEFEENEVYAIDILFTSGNGMFHRSGHESTIYKRIPKERASLKLKSSRQALNSLNSRFPLNIKEKLTPKLKFGLKECTQKGLIECYPIMEIKKNEFCARIKFTVIVKDKPMLIVAKSSNEQFEKIK